MQMPQERQRLIYRGHVLQNEQTVAQCGLENGHTVHLVERDPAVTAQPPPSTESPSPSKHLILFKNQRKTDRTTQRSTTISVNVPARSAGELQDIGRIVHGVLSAVGQGGGRDFSSQFTSQSTSLFQNIFPSCIVV